MATDTTIPPPPPGFDLTAPPTPPGGAALTFQGQWNPQTQRWEDVPGPGAAPPPPAGFDLTSPPEQKAEEQGAAERFARSFNQATTGYQGPADVVRDVRDNLWYELTRQRDTWEDTKNIWNGMKTQMDATWDRAVEDAKNGNVTSLQGLINYTNSGIHMLESGVPVIGPALAQADKQISNGDYAGGLGTFLGTALASGALERMAPGGGAPSGVTPGYAVHPGLAPEPFPTTGTATGAAAPATGIARAAQLARAGAELGKDNVLGDMIGMASPRIRHAQDFLGRLANILDKLTPAKEEVPAAPSEDIPESDAAIPADLYRQISRSNPDFNDRQIRGVGEQMMQQLRGQRIQPAPETPAAAPGAGQAPSTLEEQAISPPAEAAPGPGRRTMKQAEAETYREAQTVRATQPPEGMPAPPSSITEQLRRSLEQEQEKAAPTPPETATRLTERMPETAPPLPRDLNDALDDNALLQRLRQDMAHEASGVELEKERARYMRELPSGGATKGMETTAARAAIVEQEAPRWTQMSNWTERDTQRVLGGDYADPKALDGSKNIYVTQEQYEAALKRWKQKTGEE